MIDDKQQPLLDINLKKQHETLKEEHYIFLTSSNDIEKDLDSKNIDLNTNNLIKKLSLLKTHMQKINDKIHFLKNFLLSDIEKPGSVEQSQFLLEEVKQIGDNIAVKYEGINKKFTNVIDKARKQIQQEMEKTNEGVVINKTTMMKLSTKSRMDIDRLQERQQDLEAISKISYQLVELSREMKREAERQGRTVSRIEDYIIEANVNTHNANTQLEIRRSTQATNLRLYVWLTSALSLIIIIFIIVVYMKRTPSTI